MVVGVLSPIIQNTMKETKPNLDKAANLNPETREDAIWLAALEICGFINFSGVARKYFDRTSQWLTQRLHGNEVNGKKASFKPEEAEKFSAALRDMAAKLTKAADRIDKTKA